MSSSPPSESLDRVRLPRPARRAQLLGHALEVFAARGYHAASMDEIAERAGVSKPVLYQHFPGKLELYLALLGDSCDALVAECRTALAATGDNKQRVSATIEVFYAYVAGDSGAFRLVFESDLTGQVAVRNRVEQMNDEIADLIAQLIRDDTGLPPADCRLLAFSLVGMAQVSARFWLAEEAVGRTSGPSRADAAALVTRLAWRGIRGFPRSEVAEA
ncbi:MAG: TetR/AcrR family transcriptional regulator [Nocardioides sp.]